MKGATERIWNLSSTAGVGPVCTSIRNEKAMYIFVLRVDFLPALLKFELRGQYAKRTVVCVVHDRGRHSLSFLIVFLFPKEG